MQNSDNKKAKLPNAFKILMNRQWYLLKKILKKKLKTKHYLKHKGQFKLWNYISKTENG